VTFRLPRFFFSLLAAMIIGDVVGPDSRQAQAGKDATGDQFVVFDDEYTHG